MSGAESVAELVAKLEASTHLPNRGRAIKIPCKLFHSDKVINSWKFNEWDYGKPNKIALPINARGFFTSADNLRIVARGYDKFFNVDETPFTRWEWIEQNTKGPYNVSVKANGCIIFISGLEDGELVVCSKHSTGFRDDVDRNHAEAGEKFLIEQLTRHDIDIKEFATTLYRENVTAVAEYCDDSFEEHILEYGRDKRGLYLHGLNPNEITFQTWAMERVDTFAEKYGFNKLESFNIDTTTELRKFLETVSTKGSFNDQEIEGFVIRCHRLEGAEAFFFKFKFEEPYLMYRQWREVTKDYIEHRIRVYNFKKHKFITNKYLDFVIPILENDPIICEEYMKGFGIIKLRNMFLESYGMTGFEILNHEKIQELEFKNSIDYEKVDSNTKFLIFPIAVIGCGKTTTALILKNLFNWGHIQNDDIHNKKDKAILIKRSLELLTKDDTKCVIVDRNNHQFRERKQLFEWVEQYKEQYLSYDTNIKIIGISFVNSIDDLDRIKNVTVNRVLQRGDNHQTIQLNKYGERKVVGIMSGFWKRFQPVAEDRIPDNLFDLLIKLDVNNENHENSSLINSMTIINELHEKYPILIPKMPTTMELEDAFKQSIEFKIPSKTKEMNMNNKLTKKINPAYFSANLDNKDKLIVAIMQLMEDDSSNNHGINFEPLEKLLDENLFQPGFHITLSHVAQGKRGDPRDKILWKEYLKEFDPQLTEISARDNYQETLFKTDYRVKFKLDKLCWDDKIVAVMVKFEDTNCVTDKDNVTITGLECSNKFPHITIGRLNSDIKASYSNSLCERIMKDDADGESSYYLNFNDSEEFVADVCINL
ncbi:hypothetical protein KAFR_0A01500 [Kazachstania africana CBS 2517]|uniref:tRNA ligase n=1 Tax=Kazachstania africana (strain ATCC 22294 / BCRC 22015 / CBS 2517 / CECT 1963 / NBRC 1671 / NRRL Y-8276) TaxID=1071382 RepID=H2AMI8_KAZAF|nr:hypothetical protein KAFR_0A01500 [Kazachstania africana CBS 2517]CCF55588.1 hypothetical protein KAFR_0A01500 [Kazachstania africana CBS 2517]